MSDSARSYDAAIAYHRMMLIVTGRALPRENEPIDLLLLAASRRDPEGPRHPVDGWPLNWGEGEA